MESIEHALKNKGSLKAVKRKLGIGKNQMYALRDKQGYVTTNMDKIVKVSETSTEIYSVARIIRTIIVEGVVQRN